MEIIDGRAINVLDDSWVDSIKTLGVFEGKIAVLTKSGREYAFTPVNEAQQILYQEILKDLIDVGSVKRTVETELDDDDE